MVYPTIIGSEFDIFLVTGFVPLDVLNRSSPELQCTGHTHTRARTHATHTHAQTH